MQQKSVRSGSWVLNHWAARCAFRHWDFPVDFDNSLGFRLVRDMTRPKNNPNRVRRGGSWNNKAKVCQSSYRFNWPPDIRIDSLGFRLVREK